MKAWEHLAPYIRNERQRIPDPNYYLFFENLAFVVRQYPPEMLRKQLKLHTTPEGSAEAPGADS
jgi:hypothetical protein